MRKISLTLALLLAGCASAVHQYHDRSNVLEFGLPDNWIDETAEWDRQRKNVYPNLPKDEGIAFLSRIRRADNTGGCRFRQFRYHASEAGYIWDSKRIAYEVAAVRSKIIHNYSAMDYLRIGVELRVPHQKPFKEKIVAIGHKKLGPHKMGVSVRDYYYSGDYGAIINTTLVYVIAKPTAPDSTDNAKYYIVSECDINGDEPNKSQLIDEIFRILGSIKFIERT